MNIRIKELFKSDLDPNSNQWWSKDKIDKINYNFSLMRNGGPSGPTGIEGANGEEGEKGYQGVQGPDGPLGPQGPTGPEASGSWRSYDHMALQRIIYPSVPFNGTVVPAIGASAHNEDWQNPPSDLLSPYYGVTPASPISSLRSGSLNIITEAPISSDVLNPLDHSQQSSITLLQDRSFAQSYNIGLETDPASFPILRIGPSNTADHLNSKFNIEFDRDNIFNFGNVNINKLGSVSEINNVLNVNSSAGQIIEFKVGETEYRNHSPSLNKLLTSTDAQGTVVWENVFNIFQVFPIGSITRIPRDTFFSEDNFNLLDATTGPMVLVDGDETIRTNFGSGKLTGPYAGWYLCNGESWGDGGLIEYDTPNLNGFEWDITNIAGIAGGLSAMVSGGSVMSANGNIVFSGGVSTLGPVSGITANTIGHTYDNGNTNRNLLLAGSQRTEHVIMGEQISIIYLRQYDYEWGTVDSNSTTSNIDLQYHAMTGDLDLNTVSTSSYDNIDIAMQYATTLGPQSIQWTGTATGDGNSIDSYWNDDSNFSSGNIRCYINGQELADGWLARESGGISGWGIGWGRAREYINGVGISGDAAQQTEPKTCWMLYAEDVRDVNGTISDFGVGSGMTTPESSISNNQTLALQEVFISNKIEHHPNLNLNSDFTDYESTSHIWKVDAGYTGGSINQLTNGWYRSLPYTNAFTIPASWLNSTQYIDAGHYFAYRKYWSASTNEFKGDVIKTRYVQWSTGDLALASGSGSTTAACDATQGNDIFYSSDMLQSYENTGAWQVTNLERDIITGGNAANGMLYSWTGNQIYVREDAPSTTNGGSNYNLGKYPLTLIKSDIFIPGTETSLKIANYADETYKSINSDSKAPADEVACPGGGSGNTGLATFDFDENNNGTILNYTGTMDGRIYFTTTNLSPSLLTNSDFSVEPPTGTCYPDENSSYTTYTPGNYYVTVHLFMPCTGSPQTLTVNCTYSGMLTFGSDTAIDILANPCHVEGTIISMANGTTKLVENLKVGDVLDSFDIKGLSDSGEWRNFKTNVKEFKAPRSSAKIVRVIKGTYTNYQDINSGLTKITSEHPILIKRPDGEILFKQALYIDTTDMIYVNEKWTRVISNETIHKTVKTYSIDVENEDVYIADGILCHNIEEEKIL